MSDLTLEERRARTKAEMKLSEVQKLFDDPTQERVEECQTLLDAVKEILTESLEDPFLDRIATIEDDDELEAAKEEFANWKTTNRELYEDLVKILEQFNNDPYPWTLTVSSTGGAAEKKPQYMGTYKKTAQTRNERPVWKLSDEAFLCYNDDSFWTFQKDLTNAQFGIKSVDQYSNTIPVFCWQYYNTTGVLRDDDTLKVKASE